MTRDEALQKATEAVAAWSQKPKTWWQHSPLDKPPPCDWQNPTVHQIIAALEAIGVVTFESDLAFAKGQRVRRRKHPLYFTPHHRPVWIIRDITVCDDGHAEYRVETQGGAYAGVFLPEELEAVEDKPQFKVGQRVRYKNGPDRTVWIVDNVKNEHLSCHAEPDDRVTFCRAEEYEPVPDEVVLPDNLPATLYLERAAYETAADYVPKDYVGITTASAIRALINCGFQVVRK